MDLNLLTQNASTTLQVISARLSSVIHGSAIADFVQFAQQVGPYDDYKIFPADAQELIPIGTLADGSLASKMFLRATILQGLLNTIASDRFEKLPARIRAQQLRQIQRIALDNSISADWLNIEHDLFHKEFGISTLRLYVTGAQLVDYRCGIPRSIVFKEGLASLPKNLAAIFRLGGFRKYFQIHTHDLMLDAFNEEGWSECYLGCTELYPLHPEVLGMYGSSWFYDPALETISPRLAYLRKVPEKAGAELFFVEEGKSARSNSLATSPTRRKLYEEGKYSPKSYMLAWGKNDQIEWAKSYLNSRRESDQAQAVAH